MVLTEVAAGVWVARSAVYATTSTIVVDDDGAALVVDPGVTPVELAALAAEVRERGWRVEAGWATHAHWDHLLWHPDLGNGPRWARPGTVVVTNGHRDDLTTAWAAEVGEPGADLRERFARLTPLPAGCTDVPGSPVRAGVLGHEAHSPGHAGLYLPGPRVLLAGDMLSDVEVPLLDLEAADPLGDYGAGLDRLAAVVAGGRVDVLVPGHGGVADATQARERVALDRAYLSDLAAGRPSADPRLEAAPDWLRQEHEAQVRAVAGGARAL